MELIVEKKKAISQLSVSQMSDGNKRCYGEKYSKEGGSAEGTVILNRAYLFILVFKYVF